jgi:hypothetical protein
MSNATKLANRIRQRGADYGQRVLQSCPQPLAEEIIAALDDPALKASLGTWHADYRQDDSARTARKKAARRAKNARKTARKAAEAARVRAEWEAMQAEMTRKAELAKQADKQERAERRKWLDQFLRKQRDGSKRANLTFRTMKEALAAGFRRREPWEFGGEHVVVKGRKLHRQLQAARTRSAWSKLGFRPKRGVGAYGWRQFRRAGACDVWRPDQVEPKRTQTAGVALELTWQNILSALFTVNRYAKRCRDAASSYYERRMFGFATTNRERKEMAYLLKDKTLCYALQQGWLVPAGKHGEFTVYRGSGYCFHSLIRPDAEMPDKLSSANEDFMVESKPREATEMRLKDALATLQALPETDLPDGFVKA